MRHGRRRRLMLLLGGGWRRRGGRHVCPSVPAPARDRLELELELEGEGGERERSGDWSERQADGVGLIGEFHGQRPLPLLLFFLCVASRGPKNKNKSINLLMPSFL